MREFGREGSEGLRVGAIRGISRDRNLGALSTKFPPNAFCHFPHRYFPS